MRWADPISIAVQVAREHGLRVERPVPLRSTNNAVAWLAPAPVVAKVGVGLYSRLETELRVALELAQLGAPVVSVATELPAIVHSRQGVDITFWRYHEQRSPAEELPVERLAPALQRLHAALRNISPNVRAGLPAFTGELGVIRSFLADAGRLPALSAADRNLLSTTFDRLEAELAVLASPEEASVLHGAPHSYNVLLVDDEPCFIDFETACIGPVEWDLAHLGEGSERLYGGAIDERLLWACRAMASVKTATWCWADVERGDLREHAEWHLANVRTSIAPHMLSANDPGTARDPV